MSRLLNPMSLMFLFSGNFIIQTGLLSLRKFLEQFDEVIVHI